jgi:hypothetical protein
MPPLNLGIIRIVFNPAVASAHPIATEHGAIRDMPLIPLRQVAALFAVMQGLAVTRTAAFAKALTTFVDYRADLLLIHSRTSWLNTANSNASA